MSSTGDMTWRARSRGSGWFVPHLGPQNTSAADGTAQDKGETGGAGERGQERSHVPKPARGEDGMGKRKEGHLRAVGTVSEAKGPDPGAAVGRVWPCSQALLPGLSVL